MSSSFRSAIGLRLHWEFSFCKRQGGEEYRLAGGVRWACLPDTGWRLVVLLEFTTRGVFLFWVESGGIEGDFFLEELATESHGCDWIVEVLW